MITNGIDVNRSRKVYLWIYLCSKYTYMGRCAELVSQRAVNPSPSGIVGSSPTRPTIWATSSVGQSNRLISSNIILNYTMDTNIKGIVTELKCKTYFLELGYTVSTPENPVRYDFILDTGGKLLKVQVKTCKSDGEKLNFATCSSHFVNGKVTHTDYQNDNIDYFCTWFENECYLVPVSECGKTEKNLRLVPTKNGQVKGICFAKDYIAKEVLSR